MVFVYSLLVLFYYKGFRKCLEGREFELGGERF